MAQSVEHMTSAQVVISQSVSSSPASGSVLTARSLGACFGFCVSLSLCPSPAHALFLSLSKINKHLKKNKVMFLNTWTTKSSYGIVRYKKTPDYSDLKDPIPAQGMFVNGKLPAGLLAELTEEDLS